MLIDDYKSCSDEQLFSHVTQKDERAFDVLYDRYQKRLLVFFYRMLGQDEQQAQDFLQELFLKVVEKSASFNKKCLFRKWLFSIAHNMCKNEYRRLTVHGIVEHADDLDRFAETAESMTLEMRIDVTEFKKMLIEQLARLGPAKQETFLLRFQENFSIREISDIVGCSEGTVKSRLFYTTRYLAEKLQEYDPT